MAEDPKEVSREVAVKSFRLWREFPKVFSGINSEDPPTRRMSYYFLISLAGLIVVSGIGVHRYWLAKKHANAVKIKKMAIAAIEKTKVQMEQEKYKSSVLTVGVFNLELVTEKTRMRSAPGVMNMAQVEIVFVCDTEETRSYIEDHLVEAKSQLSDVLTAIKRDELMSREGKRKMKHKILKRMNLWLTHGKLKEIYFSRLLIS